MVRCLWLDGPAPELTCERSGEWLLNVVGPGLCHMSNRVSRLGDNMLAISGNFDESGDLALFRHADSRKLPATSPSSNVNALAGDASRDREVVTEGWAACHSRGWPAFVTLGKIVSFLVKPLRSPPLSRNVVSNCASQSFFN